MRLGVRPYDSKLTISLARSIRKSLRAEDEVVVIRQKESAAFRRALRFHHSGREDLRQQAANALAVARAVIETLCAEKQLARCLVREAELYLRQAHHMAHAVDNNLAIAVQQVSSLLDAARAFGLAVDPSHIDVNPRNYPRPGPFLMRERDPSDSDLSEGFDADEESLSDRSDCQDVNGCLDAGKSDHRQGGVSAIRDNHRTYGHRLPQVGDDDEDDDLYGSSQSWHSAVSC